jgi:hypothetical protein
MFQVSPIVTVLAKRRPAGKRESATMARNLFLRTALLAGFALSSACLGGLPSDPQIARQAVIHGNNLLARNPRSREGMILVKTGLALLPDDEDGLLALALIERGKKPQPITTPIKLSQLTGAMIQRGSQLIDKYGEEKRTEMHLALLFLRAAEPFQPTNRDLLIALKRLERGGYTQDIEDLCEQELSAAMGGGGTGGGTDEEEEEEKEPEGIALAPGDAREFRGHKYKFFPGHLTWSQARDKCEEMGGHLVTIGSAAENDLVRSVARGRRVWLGGSDQETEGRWRWARTGDSWTYRNWVRDLKYSSSMSTKRKEEYEEAATDERTDNSGEGDFLYMCPNGKWNARDHDGTWSPYSDSSGGTYLVQRSDGENTVTTTYSTSSTYYPIVGFICEWQR